MNKLEELRLKKGISRRELSELANISEKQIYLIEKKNAKPRLTSIKNIIKALNCSFYDVF